MNNNISIAIVVSSYHKKITDELLRHCLEALGKNGVGKNKVIVVWVPGSLEIPLVAKKLAKQGIYSAIIALGVIHKGETYHFELVANECARGCMNVSIQYEVPIIFEVLAVYNLEDARVRATRKKENRGVEAALTALRMIELMREIS